MAPVVNWAAFWFYTAALASGCALGCLIYAGLWRLARPLRTRLAWRRHWRQHPCYEPERWERKRVRR